MVRNDLRNVAIIAHVDHGKTTLVDALLRQSGAFRDNQAVAERVMDSGDIERERGITILAKNCSCTYKGVKINIVDTPGHADFGGEVERVLKMVNGVLLLVDAAEGCMPQTRFVLQKALQQNLSLVVAINKIDRPDARIKEVIDEVLYLLMDLGATDEQLECPMLFCCGRDGTASLDPDVPGTDLIPLFDTLLSTIKPPEGDPEAPFQMLVSSVDYNEFVGRIGIGRIQNGVAKVGEEVVVCDWHNPDLKMRGRLTKLYDFQANGRQPCDNITAGDIVAFSGLPDVTIGNTLCSPAQIEPLPFVKINDPTVEMTFSVNDSPLAGREGKYVTSRQIRDRLQKELLKDVALKVEDSATTDSFRVMGRGEMHLSILIETMRREGYELQVSPPHVLTKVIDGKTYEPMEHVVIDVPTQYQGAVMTGLGQRKALLQQIESLGTDRVRLEFRMPSRGLFGYRNQFLTDTHGEGIINQIFDGYDVWAGMIANRSTGSLVSFETGDAVTYGLYNAQQRGTLLIGAGEKVYEGMVIGYTASGRATPERAGEPHGHRAAGVLRRKKTRVRRALGTRRHPVPAGRVARAGTHPLRGDAHHRRRRRPSGQAVVVPRGGQRRAQEPAGGARARSPHRRSGRRAPRRERTAARRAAGLGARERGRRQLTSPPLPASRPIPERRLPA